MLELLNRAELQPIQALSAAIARTAKLFGVTDRVALQSDSGGHGPGEWRCVEALL